MNSDTNINPGTKNIALITGASAGLGREFARQIDVEYELDEIWLVARREDKLQELAAELSRAKGVPVVADLVDASGCGVVRAKLEAEHPCVKLFVNNAGFGRYGRFGDVAKEPQLEMIDLNCRTLTELSYDVLPYLGTGSSIVQVASLAGFVPIANHAVYAATKAYVLSFSAALAAELEEQGIRVHALCPGPVATEFANVASEGKRQRMKGAQEAPDVVAGCLRDLERGKWFSLLTWRWRATALATRFLSRRWLARHTNISRREH